jgi:hypothetical protein
MTYDSVVVDIQESEVLTLFDVSRELSGQYSYIHGGKHVIRLSLPASQNGRAATIERNAVV